MTAPATALDRAREAVRLAEKTSPPPWSYGEDVEVKTIGWHGEHYDVCAEMRASAIERGAVAVSSRRLVELRRARRRAA